MTKKENQQIVLFFVPAILALKEKQTLLDLIKKYPNDADLGENVRKIYNK